jgi:hypothetical protein
MIRGETTMYGGSALARLTAVVADLKHADPMTPVTILAPNNVAGIVARRHLAQGLGDGLAGIAGIEVSTLPRFAEQLSARGWTRPLRPARSTRGRPTSVPSKTTARCSRGTST